jgi:hypothetical protein
MTQARMGKTVDTALLCPAEIPYINFVFWDIVSHRGFNAILMIIYAKTQTLCLFCTARKKPPLRILRWFFVNLKHDNRIMSRIRVDEDGALAASTVFCKLFCDEVALNLETTALMVMLPTLTVRLNIQIGL